MFSLSSKPMEPKPAERESEVFFQLMGQLLKFLSQTEQLISGILSCGFSGCTKILKPVAAVSTDPGVPSLPGVQGLTGRGSLL